MFSELYLTKIALQKQLPAGSYLADLPALRHLASVQELPLTRRVTFLVGENGTGKSTTIRHLMGFSKPDSGSTKIEGMETFHRYFEVLNHVGYIPGEIALPAGLTGWEFIRMMQNLQKIHNEKRLGEMLKLFELEDEVLKGETKRMSLGVKRKLAVVTAFMSDPDVLILDEPTSGLDPVMQENIIQFIHEEKERGKTILLSSHIFSEIDSTCDRIAIIKDGKIVSQFVADDLKHASRKYYTVTFATEAEKAAFLQKAAVLATFQLIREEGAEEADRPAGGGKGCHVQQPAGDAGGLLPQIL